MTHHRLLQTIQTVLFDTRPALLTNSFFNNFQLKPRIQMLVNPPTNRRVLWRYVFALPVAALLLMCSQKDPVQTESPAGSRIAANSPVEQAPAVIGEVFTVVEQNPEPKGGIAELGNYLQSNLRYPEAAQKANVAGKVFVNFVVTTEGRITDVQVLKGIGFGCDAEAVRVIKQMPAWTPGRQNGRAVNVKFNLPIAFTLEEDKAAGATTNQNEEAASLAKYDHFFVDGKEVSYQTLLASMKTSADNGGRHHITTDPANRRFSITTR